MGLFNTFSPAPSPTFDVSDNGLPSLMNMDVFDRDLLLAFSPVTLQRFHLSGVGPRQFVCMGEVFMAQRAGLLGVRRSPVGFHCGVVTGHHLGGEHAFDFIAWSYARERYKQGAAFFVLD